MCFQAVVVAGKDKGPPLKLDLDITSEELEKKLRECLASRGRKATDPKVCMQRSASFIYARMYTYIENTAVSAALF